MGSRGRLKSVRVSPGLLQLLQLLQLLHHSGC